MITVTLAPCVGVDKPFASVTKETVVFSGVEVADGLQAALFDGSGTCLAVADVKDAQVELDLDTQEAVDATAPVGPGEAVSVWLVVGDKDTHVATIPCKLIRNLIDDEATHPHVPAERYPTVSELNAWLKAAGEVREGVCTCAKAAASSAEAAETAKTEAGKSATKAEESAKAAEEAVADKIDEAVADTRYLRVDSAKTNDLQQAIRFYNHTGEEPTNADGNSPFFVIGSQLKDDGSGNIKEDRWTSFWYYNGFMFRQMPESEGISFTFSRGGDDSIVRKAELDEATQDAITTDGGTVDGILRMKNPKVSADDDTRHDIALVPNANGQGLQVQFPGGSTAMIRMKPGVLATTAEVNAGLAAKQDKLIAGSGISIAEDGKTISATGGGGGGTSVTILAEWPETPDNTTVPGTKLVKDYVDGLVGDINAALEEV